MSTAANKLDIAVRAYLRERLTIAPEHTDHALDCVNVFIAAALLDEMHRLADRVVVAEAKYLAGEK
jgi:hypothetical protein